MDSNIKKIKLQRKKKKEQSTEKWDQDGNKKVKRKSMVLYQECTNLFTKDVPQNFHLTLPSKCKSQWSFQFNKYGEKIDGLETFAQLITQKSIYHNYSGRAFRKFCIYLDFVWYPRKCRNMKLKKKNQNLKTKKFHHWEW